MRDRLIRLFLLLLFLTLFINFVRSFINLYQRGDVITKTKKRLQEATEEQDKLKRELVKTESQEYIEKQAREKLNLSKEGEIVLILPPISPIATTPAPVDNLSNWQKWMKVFSKKGKG